MTVDLGVPKAISKVYKGGIVNTHFRYQLRKVEFKVGIFLYWRNLRRRKFEI